MIGAEEPWTVHKKTLYFPSIRMDQHARDRPDGFPVAFLDNREADAGGETDVHVGQYSKGQEGCF